MQKYAPESLKTRVKKTARFVLNHLGLDAMLKHWLKKQIGPVSYEMSGAKAVSQFSVKMWNTESRNAV